MNTYKISKQKCYKLINDYGIKKRLIKSQLFSLFRFYCYEDEDIIHFLTNAADFKAEFIYKEPKLSVKQLTVIKYYMEVYKMKKKD